MARVYLDTSFVSACVTNRDDPASIYRRDASREWMRTQTASHEIYVSAEVVKELDRPVYPQRDAAMSLIASLPLLKINDAVLGLAGAMVREKVMPGPIGGDSVHVAACCLHRIEFLLTWNVRHLANPNKLRHLRSVAVRAGVVPPTIVTPDLLWEAP